MAGPATQRHTRTEWQQIVAQYQASGQDKMAFCRARSIKADCLRHGPMRWT